MLAVKLYYCFTVILISFISYPVPTSCLSAEKKNVDQNPDLKNSNELTSTALPAETAASNSSTTEKKRKILTKKKTKDNTTTPRKKKTKDNTTRSRNKKTKDNTTTTPKKRRTASTTTRLPIVVPISDVRVHKDDSLLQFQNICSAISSENSYLNKTNVLKEFFKKGTDGDSFKGNLKLWGRLLLPGTERTIYSLQNKRLVTLFSQIFQTNLTDMLTDLEAGDISATISKFFKNSTTVKPCAESTLSLQDTDACLQTLSTLTKEDDQLPFLTAICKKFTTNDLQIFVRLIKHDLRINAGPKHILDALHPDAYEAFKTSHDINAVIDQIHDNKTDTGTQSLNISVKLLTPVKPMLAQPCKSLEEIIRKHEQGLYAEIKYDGERVQLHKQGFDFKYISRSLKPVQPHKVNHFADYIKKAFPFGEDMVLDCEVLMIDTKTGDPLPFGSLGKHKINEFKDANPCLIIFDCLYFNGQSLLNRTLKERYNLLQKNMNEISNHVQISKQEQIKNLTDLESMLTNVLDKGLEGLVLKNPMGVYEPGKRHWIKVKRDHLFEGQAADTVDLVVLGAYYGSGRRGGIMTVFLMGCYDAEDKCWRSVTKTHISDDKTLETLQTELDMIKISRDVNQVPNWLNITKPMVPDFVARDPKLMPVWEVAGHEFTKCDAHTANGISIRFPRVVKIRDDKTWETATTLTELKDLVQISKQNVGSRLKSFFSSPPNATSTPSDNVSN